VLGLGFGHWSFQLVSADIGQRVGCSGVVLWSGVRSLFQLSPGERVRVV
jgi:hypothetical protein